MTTDVKYWSTTAADNATADADINWQEGQAPSTVNGSARTMMAAIRSKWQDAEWFNYNHSITYVAATQFRINALDVTSIYTVGRRVKIYGSLTGTIYGTITAVAFSTNTTVTISFDSGSLTSETLNVSIGILNSSNDSIPYLNKKSADVASASTVDFNAVRGDLIDVTGTTSITAITLREGQARTVRFTDILTLTHGSSLILPSAANITTAAGDFAIFRGYASGVVRCVNYSKLNGTPISNSNTSTDLALSGKFATISSGPKIIASGAIEATGSNHSIDTEGSSASDDLDTISGESNGMVLSLNIADDARNVVIKHNTGNIYNPNGLDIALDSTKDSIILQYQASSSKWIVVGVIVKKIFISSEQTITLGGSLTLPHTLPTQPQFYLPFLKCTDDNAGYVAGQETPFMNTFGDAWGVSIIPNATNLVVRFGVNTPFVLIANSGSATTITVSKWKLIIKAFNIN